MNSSKRLEEFVCWECGNCCRGEGFVAVSGEDIERIAEYLGMDALEFTQTYTKLEKSRRGLVLKDKGEDSACIFLNDDNRCEVYQVRPEQCVGFPYTWNYPGWWKRCENTCSIEDRPLSVEHITRGQKPEKQKQKTC